MKFLCRPFCVFVGATKKKQFVGKSKNFVKAEFCVSPSFLTLSLASRYSYNEQTHSASATPILLFRFSFGTFFSFLFSHFSFLNICKRTDGERERCFIYDFDSQDRKISIEWKFLCEFLDRSKIQFW